MSWVADGLFLACMTKRGCLLILPRFGQPIKLVTYGCSVEMGPISHLPPPPLITVTYVSPPPPPPQKKNNNNNNKIKNHSFCTNPLIIISFISLPPFSGAKKKTATDHENSLSSQKDSFRQRFSVASHPSLPLIVCSDGYTLTVLRMDSKQGMLELLKSLVTDSRKRLGLEDQTEHTGPGVGEGGGGGTLHSISTKARNDVHDFIATITEGSEFGAALRNSFDNLGYPGAFAGLDEGAIHFAGESCGSSLLDSNSKSEKQPLHVVVSQLQAAMGVLISCEPFVPCIGMLPNSEFLKLHEVAAYKYELCTLANMLVSTLSKIVSEASVRNEYLTATTSTTATPTIATTSTATTPATAATTTTPATVIITTAATTAVTDEVVSMSDNLITSFIKLVTLDGLKQNHMNLTLSLANAVLIAKLSGLIERHCDFEKLRKDQYTLNSLNEYVKSISSGIQGITNRLEDIIAALEASYRERPSIFGDILRDSEIKTNNYVHFLAPSLTILLKLVSILWKDVKLSKKLVRSQRHSSPIQPREVDLVCTNTNALSSLKTLHRYINGLLSSSCHRLSNSDAPRSPCKPITFTQQSSDKCKIFLNKLLLYDLRAVIEITDDSIMAWEVTDTRELISTSQSADRLSDILNCSSLSREELTSQVISAKSDFSQFILGTVGGMISSYFTDKKILIPVSSDTLSERHEELIKSKLTRALHHHSLADCWTVERAVNLLLLSGKWEKACDFIVELGDWRKAFVLATAASVHNQRVRKSREKTQDNCEDADRLCKFSHQLALVNVLKVIRGVYNKPGKKDILDGHSETPSKTSERFVLETFCVCALSEMDSVLRSCTGCFLDELVRACMGSMTTRVPLGLYLPAPPLYCIQPAITEEVLYNC